MVDRVSRSSGGKIASGRGQGTAGTRKSQGTPPSFSLTPKAKEIRTNISGYVDRVITTRSSFRVLSRGKEVAVLGPVNSLPKGQQVKRAVSTTDIAKGTSTFAGVVHHGPYVVTRNGEPVAVMYSPFRSAESRMEELLREIDELRILEEAKKRRVDLRGRADKAIEARIAVLRDGGGGQAADQLEAAWRAVDREI